MATLAPGQTDSDATASVGLNQPNAAAPAPHWHLATRIAFRFCVLYFTLYCLGNQILTSLLPLPGINIPDPSTLWPIRLLPVFAAVHIFHVPAPIAETGSGDRMFDYALTFSIFVIAVAGTILWSALDRRRESYPSLYKWFRLFIRISLAGQMLIYGMSKAFPNQMPGPYLMRLVEPYGHSSPMGILWSFIGTSKQYETFAGCCELLGGILLFLPSTAMFGALVSLAAVTHVFMLNMTYDVPVKLLSFHLIVLCLFLLAPDLRRLRDFFILDRGTSPSANAPLLRSARANRIALWAQVVAGIFLLGENGYAEHQSWVQNGPGRVKSPLYGVWDVEEMSIDGQIRSPLVTDYDRWRRLIFDLPVVMNFQRMDDSLVYYRSSIDPTGSTLALTKGSDKNWKATFAIERPAPEQLILDGAMDGHQIHLQMRLFDRNKFLLINRGFHWIQENPFNR